MATISRSGHDITPLPPAQREALASRLDPKTYEVTQKAGTEPAFCGTLLDNKKDGTYYCVVCGLPLFSSEHKFTSGTGWPSFFAEFDPQHVGRSDDSSHGMLRTEISCVRCGSHLGHVFPDGPPPSGERHCLNSLSLTFLERGQPVPDASKPIDLETAYFAGGCFWGIEHYMQKGVGVIDAVSGYMQGAAGPTTYQDVCSGATNHAETVMVLFDPRTITYRELVDAFFRMHDPTEVNRQGPDVGTQYRSGIWTSGPEQEAIARAAIADLEASGTLRAPVATQVEPAKEFHPAERYHQDYVARTGRACHITNPWPATTPVDSDH
ncbi:MAG: bifunctional methionine sulfoxide reductase B/A protein [Phycisphaerales bacterium]|nr:bifunctional methionine sulfoxide reductase B/A protein [Phycisphaerales bacterium]